MIKGAGCYAQGKFSKQNLVSRVSEGDIFEMNDMIRLITHYTIQFRRLIPGPLARSELFGYADDGSSLNPKYEIRNPKQYLMTQIQMIKTRPWRYKFKLCLNHLSIRYLYLFRISIFGFRIYHPLNVHNNPL